MRFYHDQMQSGIKQTRRTIQSTCTWPNIAREIKAYVEGCLSCQRSKVLKHHKPAIHNFQLPTHRFAHVHLDFVGPLPVSHKGNNMLMTFIDRYTRFPVAVALSNSNAETAVETLI